MSTGEIEIRQPRRIPAWVFSALLHCCLVVLLPYLLVGGASQVELPSSGREVGIVLSQVRPDSQTEYFSESSVSESTQDTTTSQDASLPQLEATTSLVPSELTLEVPKLDLNGSRLLKGPQVSVRSTPRRITGGRNRAEIMAEEAARRKQLAARGAETTVSLFGGVPANGRTFIFLIDRSKSMGRSGLGALEVAEKELLKSLGGLQPVHKFQVIAYHHQCVYLDRRSLLQATPENIARIEGHLSNLAAFGSTEHLLALMSALRLEPDVIFLLTDGGDPALTDGDLKQIRKLSGGRTSIHCIQFGHGALQERGGFLERLAAQNRGGYGYVDMSQ